MESQQHKYSHLFFPWANNTKTEQDGIAWARPIIIDTFIRKIVPFNCSIRTCVIAIENHTHGAWFQEARNCASITHFLKTSPVRLFISYEILYSNKLIYVYMCFPGIECIANQLWTQLLTSKNCILVAHITLIHWLQYTTWHHIASHTTSHSTTSRSTTSRSTTHRITQHHTHNAAPHTSRSTHITQHHTHHAAPHTSRTTHITQHHTHHAAPHTSRTTHFTIHIKTSPHTSPPSENTSPHHHTHRHKRSSTYHPNIILHITPHITSLRRCFPITADKAPPRGVITSQSVGFLKITTKTYMQIHTYTVHAVINAQYTMISI